MRYSEDLEDRLKANEQRKSDWIESKIDNFKGCRRDVITFIANIAFYPGSDCDSDVISDLFEAGYCYYFALMLKDAFGGEICWHKNHSHIVWRDGSDDMDICYDISGVFYDYGANEMVQISALGDMLEVFRHRGKDDTVETHMFN